MPLPRLTGTLKSASVEEVQQDTIGKFFPFFVRYAGRFKFSQVVSLDQVAVTRVHISRCQNDIALTVNSDEPSFPEQRVGELDIELADVDRGGKLSGLGTVIYRRHIVLLLERRAF